MTQLHQQYQILAHDMNSLFFDSDKVKQKKMRGFSTHHSGKSPNVHFGFVCHLNLFMFHAIYIYLVY